MKLLIILLFFVSCTKHSDLKVCNRIKIISDKYHLDSTFWKSDTDKFDYGCVPDSSVKTILALPDQWYTHCADSFIEHLRYVVNRKDVYPFWKK